MEVDRYWLLTSTTYGTWLPGEERGFVSRVPDGQGGYLIHNIPQTPYDHDRPTLRRHAQRALQGAPIYLTLPQALAVWRQFQETAEHRNWQLFAGAVMANHFHLVVGVPGDPEAAALLRDFKSYASGALNRIWKKPPSGTWWTESGSRRKLPDEDAVVGAILYVKNQERPLVVWVHDDFA